MNRPRIQGFQDISTSTRLTSSSSSTTKSLKAFFTPLDGKSSFLSIILTASGRNSVNWVRRAGRGIEFNHAAEVFYGPVNACEPKARAFARPLGGKKRFKDAGLCFFIHAASGVAHAQAQKTSGRDFPILAYRRFRGRGRPWRSQR